MKILQRQLPMNHNLFLFGDAHLGSRLHHAEGFDTLIDMIQSPYEHVPARNNFAVDHGDGIEGIMITDPRYHPDSQPVDRPVPYPLQQANDYIAKLMPIRQQMLCMMDGNHFQKLWAQGNYAKLICKELGIPYGTWTARLTYNNMKGKLMYRHYATHGRKGISSTADDISRRVANMQLILKRQLMDMAGDCVLQSKGHVHKLLITPPQSRLYITDDGNVTKQRYTKAGHTEEWIHPDHRWYVCTGSFLRTFGQDISGYAEMFEYAPVELGFAIVLVRDGQIQDIHKYVL